MLEFLRIQNLALIDDIELEFAPGLNVLTGETGAGKSFILRALNFLTGDKLAADFVRAGRDKAIVEAVFIHEGEDLILRRELAADTGRSRLYVNDRLSSIESVSQLKASLFVHTSQHAQQKLLSPVYQSKIIDSFLADPSLLEKRDTVLRELRAVLDEITDLEERSKELLSQRDFLEFQQAEIGKVNPRPGEEDELLARKQVAGAGRQAQESLDAALSIIYGPEGGLGPACHALAQHVRELAEFFPDYKDEVSAVEECAHTLDSLADRLRRQDVSEGEEDVEAIESRLYELAQLKRKLKRELDEIVHLGQEIEENLSFLDSCGLDLKRLGKKKDAFSEKLLKAVTALDAARSDAAATLAAAMEKELKYLGFSEHVRVSTEFTPRDIVPGIPENRGRLMWIPNPGQAPQPLDRIASGGELSRFLLALVGILAEDRLPTLIFDEVDTGVGGLTLNSVGDKISELSTRQQVVLITHWPQLAAGATRHFKVTKKVENNETFTVCDCLEENGVFEELVRMAGGGKKGLAVARSLKPDHEAGLAAEHLSLL